MGDEKLPTSVPHGSEPTVTDFAGILLAELSSFSARAIRDATQMVNLVEVSIAPYTSLLRPWREFFTIELPDLDSDPDFLQRIVRNIAYFQANYLMIGSVMFAVAVYRHTSWLLAILLLAGFWAAYIARGGFDPHWKPVVFGTEITASHRLALLYAGSLSLIFLVFGQALLVLLGILGTLTATHALCHAGPPKPAAPVAAAAGGGEVKAKIRAIV
ncbi:Rabac1 [Symbiodinium pilosum]|uniref:PRA1 family protein n=1 Tax=Symbiodinium pilosum TaxID=2952 RepID=A0A812XK24_SYMPI|nr:Rabac1 [Symbiodinium pilosum]